MTRCTASFGSDHQPCQRERKFLIEPGSARVFWAAASARLRPHHIDPSRPVAFVRTTYFDTPDFAYYQASSSTRVSRRLRVREYAVSAESDSTPLLSELCYLELKQSAGGLRTKSRVPLRPAELSSYLTRFGGAALAPCLTTWYRRAALTDEADRVRVTLDDRIRFCAPTPVGSPWSDGEPPHIIASGPAFVLEVKLWDDPPTWLVEALGGIREAVGYSKFMAGMAAARERGLFSDPTLADAATGEARPARRASQG